LCVLPALIAPCRQLSGESQAKAATAFPSVLPPFFTSFTIVMILLLAPFSPSCIFSRIMVAKSFFLLRVFLAARCSIFLASVRSPSRGPPPSRGSWICYFPISGLRLPIRGCFSFLRRLCGDLRFLWRRSDSQFQDFAWSFFFAPIDPGIFVLILLST